jgi:hypothetical protein
VRRIEFDGSEKESNYDIFGEGYTNFQSLWNNDLGLGIILLQQEIQENDSRTSSSYKEAYFYCRNERKEYDYFSYIQYGYNNLFFTNNSFYGFFSKIIL